MIPAEAVEAAEYVFDIDAINESVMRLFEKLSEPESPPHDPR